jgi:hypothetical protein
MIMPKAVIASEAKQSSFREAKEWIASSQVLLAMTGIDSELSRRIELSHRELN